MIIHSNSCTAQWVNEWQYLLAREWPSFVIELFSFCLFLFKYTLLQTVGGQYS